MPSDQLVFCLWEVLKHLAYCMQKPTYSFFVAIIFLAVFLTNYLHLFVFAADIFSCSLECETLENITLNMSDFLLVMISFQFCFYWQFFKILAYFSPCLFSSYFAFLGKIHLLYGSCMNISCNYSCMCVYFFQYCLYVWNTIFYIVK